MIIKKTIYYDNALLKVYDIPIFYFPKLSHPDPSVERRSGFLPAYISDTKNLGSSIYIPYFFAINDDKNFTLTNRFFAKENPLFLGSTIKHLNILISLLTLVIPMDTKKLVLQKNLDKNLISLQNLLKILKEEEILKILLR